MSETDKAIDALFEGVVAIARENEVFRKQLLTKLRRISRIATGNGTSKARVCFSTSPEALQQVADAFERVKRRYLGTSDEHRLLKPGLFSEIAIEAGLSLSQAKDRYYKAIKGGFLNKPDDRRLVRGRSNPPG